MSDIYGYCDHCGGPLPDSKSCYGWTRSDDLFCSENCAESAEDAAIESNAESGVWLGFHGDNTGEPNE